LEDVCLDYWTRLFVLAVGYFEHPRLVAIVFVQIVLGERRGLTRNLSGR
jgi:hypothetical protein